MACDPIKKSKSLVRQVQKSATSRAPGGPTIVRPNVLGTKPFSFSRLIADELGEGEPAAFERDQVGKFRKAMTGVYGGAYSGGKILLPTAWHMLPEEVRYDRSFAEFRDSLDAGVSRDPEEIARVRKAMGASDQLNGGAMVALPQQGEFIPVLRPDTVFGAIKGARSIPLPPQAAIYLPRQTGVTIAQPGVENPTSDFTSSGITTDQVELAAKPIIAFVTVSNQLLRFTEGAAEAVVREDLGLQLALTFDKCGLEGEGGANTIRGLLNIPGVGQVTSAGAGTNGDTFASKDPTRLLGKLMSNNANPNTWLMRPEFWLGIQQFRSGPVTGGAETGQFLWDYARSVGDGTDGQKFMGRPVVTSTILSNTRVKGSGANLTYIAALQADQVMVGMHGAVELMTNNSGLGFRRNQSEIRAIMYGDVNIRQQAGFAFMDNLLPLLDLS